MNVVLEGANEHRFFFWCPGCECMHQIDAQRWTFNGDLKKPTVSPSILVTMPHADGDQRCHSYVTDGRIRFLGDSTHALAGQTVALTPPP